MKQGQIIRQDRRGPIVVLLLFGAIAIQAVQFPAVSWDMTLHTLRWFAHIERMGPVGAFSVPFGNYTPPYLYLLSLASLLGLSGATTIKLVSSFGAALVSLSVYRLLTTVRAERPVEGALWAMLLPTVAINAGFMAQADAFWAAPAVMAVAAALRGNNLALVAWAGLAFSVKAQAAFLAPFVLAVLFYRRVPLRHWLVPALVYVLAILPAWLAGWPLMDLLTKYYQQSTVNIICVTCPEPTLFIGNAANWIGALIFIAPATAAKMSAWVGLALAASAAAAYIAYFSRHEPTISAAVLSAAAMPFLLPMMHERFMFLADVLAFAWAWSVRTKRAVAIAVLIELGSLLAYIDYYARAYFSASGSAFTAAGAVAMSVGLALALLDVRHPPGRELYPAYGRSGLTR